VQLRRFQQNAEPSNEIPSGKNLWEPLALVE
jgi:hypothetical protein